MISLLLHALLVVWAKGFVVHGMSREYLDKIVPRTFRIERAEIDPRLLDPEPAEERSASLSPVAVNIPEDKVAFDSLMADPGKAVSAPSIVQPKLSDNPSLTTTDFTTVMETVKSSGTESLLDDPAALRQALLSDKPSPGPVTAENSLTPEMLAGSPVVPEGALRGGNQPGFSNLDELLAKTGPLSSETAPILMPTDLLYDYDSSDLREAAVESLTKLATLIRRNPQASFLIEGHTDSFGSAEYNLELSSRRAESVRSWLVQAMAIPPERVQTIGFGKSQLIAPATGTIEEQQINRRVEIVIRAKPSQ